MGHRDRAVERSGVGQTGQQIEGRVDSRTSAAAGATARRLIRR
ncbi:hypothetical protein [Streptomyces atroolivaceus]|uniref:Uncharacterized protein n=1 Tax=Streptomyces atroolivaceus TaxID=66869 RepID=A0ABV9VDY7_STRAZ|nr:hypothetical protein [Streptomyces atroolivaceus]